ncbi:uncharacterized protein LOC112524488 [Cynara cardunculus var. scolymus]|uniref:uncharacterized protein LOC112524488 n=1 Tax=Cynara cardunculus var. scolymus TaxID=59895 RepID=UPI000D630511|nr:uncharacterized protein LOC112524488 [Cynara cardunculus var. scolymus]
MIDQVWDTEPWKRKSMINKVNRNTQFEGVSSRHTGGSISIAQHRDRMAKVMGREPTATEVFERTHCTNQKFDQDSSDPPTDPPRFSYPKAARYHVSFLKPLLWLIDTFGRFKVIYFSKHSDAISLGYHCWADVRLSR